MHGEGHRFDPDILHHFKEMIMLEAIVAGVIGFVVAMIVLISVVISVLGAVAAAVLPFLLFILVTVWTCKAIGRAFRSEE